MAGNSLGRAFRVTTLGESHGKAVGAIIDGCPSGLPLCEEDFKRDMERRRPGKAVFETPRKETDSVEILSGVFEGRTTGAPIALLIANRDASSRPYGVLRDLFRPGHGDYTYYKKYGHFDYRGGGRYSGRETAARVAAGVVAGKILSPLKIEVLAYTIELGGIRVTACDPSKVREDPLFCPDPVASKAMQEALVREKERMDSLGGIVEARVSGCMPGLGEPVFDKLDADLAKAIMSVPAVKGVEIGEGFGAAAMKGSRNNDPIGPDGFRTNHAGGILAGISNGDEIVLRAAVKPIPSVGLEQETIDRKGIPSRLKLSGRHDVCAIPRIVPVLEAMIKLVLVDHWMRAGEQKPLFTGEMKS